MSNSDFSSLPVAPEFVEALTETATQTTLAYLEKTNAPQELRDLVESAFNLGYYLTVVYRNPESLAGERRRRFDIEAVVIEAINAIAKLGGEFYAPSGTIQAREVESGE